MKAARVCGVVMHTVRDDTEIIYNVNVVTDDGGWEAGDDERGVWQWRVSFGATDATVAGGARFVEAARCQQQIADEVWAQRRDQMWDGLDNPWLTRQP